MFVGARWVQGGCKVGARVRTRVCACARVKVRLGTSSEASLAAGQHFVEKICLCGGWPARACMRARGRVLLCVRFLLCVCVFFFCTSSSNP